MGDKDREVPGFNQELEEYRQVKEVIANYPMMPFSLRRDGDAWAVETDSGPVRVERFRHSLPEFFFVLSAVGFLREKGFGSLPKIFNNLRGQPVTEHSSGLFCVMENPPGEPINAREIDVLTGITRHLAELHRASVGFNPPPVVAGIRQDWGDWEEKWQYRLDELYRLGEEAQHHKGDFEHLYLKVLDDFIQDGVNALEKLKSLDIRAIIEDERLRGGLCQRDYKPVNILAHKDGYWLRDYDDFAGQSHLEDVARFIKEVGGWEAERIQYIFDVYSQVYNLSEQEKEAVLAYLKLPLDLWKVARNHYLRGKPEKHNLKAVIQEMTKRKRCFNQLENPRHLTMPVGHLPWVWGLPTENPPSASVDEYWGHWNWGDNWQVNAWTPQTYHAEELPEVAAELPEEADGGTTGLVMEDVSAAGTLELAEEQPLFIEEDKTAESVTDQTEKEADDCLVAPDDHEAAEVWTPHVPVMDDGSLPEEGGMVEPKRVIVWKSFPKPLK